MNKLLRVLSVMRATAKQRIRCVYMPVAKLQFTHGKMLAAQEFSRPELPVHFGIVLEILTYRPRLNAAYGEYTKIARQSSTHKLATIDFSHRQTGVGLVVVGHQILLCGPKEIDDVYRLANLLNKTEYLPNMPPVDVIDRELRDRGVIRVRRTGESHTPIVNHLAKHYDIWQSLPIPTFDNFSEWIEALWNLGLITAPFGDVQVGDLRRMSPLCPSFGYSRGTPVDRYYLGQFVADIRNEVVGRTLEVGGTHNNVVDYGLVRTREFVTMELVAGNGVDIVADVHDETAIVAESIDTILIFNVLEHCARPWVVANNMYRWLSDGGKVFAMVPNTQRVHRGPKDYWRIMPDGLTSLFSSYENVQVKTYGSVFTSIGMLVGLAAEEISDTILCYTDPMYPAITCITAQKQCTGSNTRSGFAENDLR